MTKTILAQIRSIRTGHSERAQIYAVGAGLDYKLEVSSDEIPGAVGDILVLSWSVHPNPAIATPIIPAAEISAPAQSAPPTGDAADVDHQFDALMRGAAARQALTPEQQLAALLLGAPGQKPG